MAETTRAGVSRRRVLQGAAWATPAILIATAVPAAANGSQLIAPTLHITRGGTGATRSVTQIYRVDNDSAYDITRITVTFTVTKGRGAFTNLPYDVVAADITSSLPGGWSGPVIGNGTQWATSTATLTYQWEGDITGAGTAEDLSVTLRTSGDLFHPVPSFPAVSASAIAVSATSDVGPVTIITA